MSLSILFIKELLRAWSIRLYFTLHVHMNKYSLYLDTDTCKNHNLTCEYTCDNSSGSFECICKNGFELETNGINCTGKLIIFGS